MSKQQLIQQFVDNNIGQEYRSISIAEAVGCTLPTVLSFIKNNSDRFEKISHGKYLIKSQVSTVSVSESASESDTVDPTVDNLDYQQTNSSPEVTVLSTYESTIPRPTFDW